MKKIKIPYVDLFVPVRLSLRELKDKLRDSPYMVNEEGDKITRRRVDPDFSGFSGEYYAACIELGRLISWEELPCMEFSYPLPAQSSFRVIKSRIKKRGINA